MKTLTLNSVKVSSEAKTALEYVRDNGAKHELKDNLTGKIACVKIQGFLNPAIKKTKISSIIKNITQIIDLGEDQGREPLAKIEQDQETILVTISPTGLRWFEVNSSTTNSTPLFTLEFPKPVWVFILKATAKEEFRAVFCHAGISETGKLFATDGFRLHEVETGLTLENVPSIPKGTTGENHAVIPKEAVTLLAKSAKTQILEFHGSFWKIGSTKFETPESFFPDYRRVIPESFDLELGSVDPFLDTVQMLGKIGKEYRGYGDKVSIQTVSDNNVTLLENSSESDFCAFNQVNEIKTTSRKNDVSLAFRLNQILDAVSTLEVKALKFSSEKYPSILEGIVNGLRGIALINPLRV